MPTRHRVRTALVAAATAASAAALCGCATRETLHRDWSNYDGPGAEHFRKEELVLWEVDDPREPMNRVVDDVKHGAAEYVIAPVAWVWRAICPKPVRKGLTNVGRNIAYPVRLVSNAVQGNWARAGTETERFAVNTTVGILGWSDAAADRGTPAPLAQDTGLALRHHGWKDSTYMPLPEATVRDTVGYVPDILLDPLTYVSGAGLARAVNDASGHVDTYVTFTKTTYDPYRLERLVRYLDRTLEETDREFSAGEGGAVDTLQYVFLGVRDAEFPDEAETSSVVLPTTGRRLEYTYWLQPHAAPVLYVLPGTGGHRDAESTAAIAELGFDAGYHVAALSSTLNFEFIESAATVDFPGFAPADARDTHVAITAIDAGLRGEHGGRIGRRRAVMGMSMGAFHALYIAAAESEAARQGLVPIDAYVALNPPVSLLQAAREFDTYFNLPLEHYPDRATRDEQIKALLRHVIDVAGVGDLRPGRPLPLNDLQAQFLIGIAFRMTLMDVLDHARALGRTDGFFLTPRTDRDRTASYRELARYSFMEYLHAFVLPEQARRRDDVTNDDAGARRLDWLCDLRSIEPQLQRNPHVRVFSNANEILLRPEDLVFLKNTFGGRLTVNDGGGHLGSLWRPEVRDRLIEQLRHLLPTEQPRVPNPRAP